MEYIQLTLNDWLEMKQKIKLELQGIKQSFVRIGYHLRKIEDQKLYERDGYKTISEFAEKEYGLKATTVSRFMAINRAYSVDGYSETLRPEFAELGRSQLEEMLNLPEEDRSMIRPETSREEIRELKRFGREQPKEGVADELEGVIRNFYQDHPEIAGALRENWKASTKAKAELVNPGGNRSYRKGMFYLMMYENKISVKKYGSAPQEMTWEQFFTQSEAILSEYEDQTEEENPTEEGEKPETPDPVTEEPDPIAEEPEEIQEKKDEKCPELQEKTLAPAQVKKSIAKENHVREQTPEPGKGEEPEKGPDLQQIEGQMSLPEDYPGTEPEVEDPPITRKEYIDTLTAWGTAEYLRKTLDPTLLESQEALYQWLLEKVDQEKGETDE